MYFSDCSGLSEFSHLDRGINRTESTLLILSKNLVLGERKCFLLFWKGWRWYGGLWGIYDELHATWVVILAFWVFLWGDACIFCEEMVRVSLTFLLIIRDLKNNEISWTIEDMNGAFSGLDKLRRLWVGFASWWPPCLTYTRWTPCLTYTHWSPLYSLRFERV